MIIELTPENYFQNIKTEGPLHVVMHYGVNCGPCKMTMPHYERVAEHFLEYNVTNVKFYKFHHWETSYKDFIEQNNLKTNGVPTFRYFYFAEELTTEIRSYGNADELKKSIMDVIVGIEKTMNMEFNLYAS